MKKKSLVESINQSIKSFLCLFPVILIFIVTPLVSQEEKGSTSAKAHPIMNLSYKKTDGVISVKVKVSTKVEKKNVPVVGPIVSLFQNEVKNFDSKTGDGLLGNLQLDEAGIAYFEMNGVIKNVGGKLHEIKFVAQMKGNENYSDKEEEVSVKDANINISIIEKDSVKMVTAKLTEWKDSVTEAPIVGADLKLGIKRTFSILPFGGDLVTDANGSVSAQLPNDVIGESDGTLIVSARIEDNETYGNVQSSKVIPWAILPKKNAENKRNLWSTGRNAPYSLVLTAVIIIFGIWGIIFYLVTLLFKINKLGKKRSTNN